MLIEAAARLKAGGQLASRWSCWPATPRAANGYVQALQEQVARAGLKDHVRLVGHVEDVAAAFLAAHVTVVASTEPEAFGRARPSRRPPWAAR